MNAKTKARAAYEMDRFTMGLIRREFQLLTAQAASASVDEVPYGKYDDCPYNRPNKSGTLIRTVPANCLAEISGHESPDNSKDGRQDEAGQFFGAGVNPFSDKARKEAD
jgi:hypothetical protein